MAEIIYTKINPNDYDFEVTNLVKDVKKNGFLYPVILEMVDNKIKNLSIGIERWLIGSSLDKEIPVILYSKYDNKTGLDGISIEDMNHSVELFGYDFKNQPTYDNLQNRLKELPNPR